jgi:unsaturated chondroitin disaccharide hydrolase
LTAADSLLSRFNGNIGAITISGDPKKRGLTAIDTMMNLPLLWWAYEKTDDKKYYDVACKHAFTTMQHYVREDSSTCHIVEFDPDSGQVRKKVTWQGYNDESCWSRGHVWAVYGFAIAYRYTKREEFLRTAEKLADYYVANCPPDYVPYWDFNDPEIPNTVKNSSAAAITSSGMLYLSNAEPDETKAEKYREVAYKILEALSKNYLADNSSQGILLHGCFDNPKNIAIDSGLIWGDYYYFEALTKLV